jgi:hypothetical protein
MRQLCQGSFYYFHFHFLIFSLYMRSYMLLMLPMVSHNFIMIFTILFHALHNYFCSHLLFLDSKVWHSRRLAFSGTTRLWSDRCQLWEVNLALFLSCHNASLSRRSFILKGREHESHGNNIAFTIISQPQSFVLFFQLFPYILHYVPHFFCTL